MSGTSHSVGARAFRRVFGQGPVRVLRPTHAEALAYGAEMMEEMARLQAMTVFDPMGLGRSHGTNRPPVG
jgi:hypothetical protein